MNLLTHLIQRASQNWLIGVDSAALLDIAKIRFEQITRYPNKTPTVFLAESDPTQFLAGFIAACAVNCPVFLCNPNWAETEWQQVFSLAHPDLIFGVVPPFSVIPITSTPLPGWIMIPTGGSSGKIRFAIHTLETLTAAVQGFQAYFEVEQINACCVLPLYHVSGLMQFLRSLLSEGTLAIVPFKRLEHSFETAFGSIAVQPQKLGSHPFLSLVPTQLQRLLQKPTAIDWLQQWETIFIGGAPAWPELLAAARKHQIRLAPTYGMTETAAQVATLKPDLFLQGVNGCGQGLPHAAIQIGNTTAPTEAGIIAIQAKSLMLGYFPDPSQPNQFLTDDLGYLDARGHLHVVGRNSQKIITGGENVFPTEVEAAIRATGLVNDVCVVGMPDQTWGEVVTAVYIPRSAAVTCSALKAALEPRLSSFKHPKQWFAVKSLPRNAQGKINLDHLRQIL
jgi:O-succinylbenzoic acid--CoA ligase